MKLSKLFTEEDLKPELENWPEKLKGYQEKQAAKRYARQPRESKLDRIKTWISKVFSGGDSAHKLQVETLLQKAQKGDQLSLKILRGLANRESWLRPSTMGKPRWDISPGTEAGFPKSIVDYARDALRRL